MIPAITSEIVMLTGSEPLVRLSMIAALGNWRFSLENR